MRALLLAVTLVTLLLTGLPAAAAGYRVDSSGGPLTLPDDVAAAILTWSRLVTGVDLTEGAGDMEVRFAAGEPGGAGPDTVTLTLQDSAGPVHLTVLVNPLLYRTWPAALLHEAGIMLGAGPASTGIMNPALGAGTPAEPQESDLELLRLARSRVPGDLNGDGAVDWLDLLELAAAFGQRGVNLPGDLDGDGVITDADLQLLRQLYAFHEPREEAGPEPEPEPEPAGPAEPAEPAGAAG